MIRIHLFVLALVATAACGAAPRPAPRDPLASTTAAELARRGLAYERAGDGVRAEQYLMAAVASGLPEAEVIEALLRVCVAQSRYGAALRHAERWRARHPEAWDAGLLVASLHGAIGDAERERAELEDVVARWPDAAPPRFALATVLADGGDRRRARAELRAYLALAPDGEHADAARERLRALDRKGRRR